MKPMRGQKREGSCCCMGLSISNVRPYAHSISTFHKRAPNCNLPHPGNPRRYCLALTPVTAEAQSHQA
jgi:hypothetical protein